MQAGPQMHKEPKYTIHQWALIGFYPVLKVCVVPFTQPLAKVAAEQQKSVTQIGGPNSFLEMLNRIVAKRGLKGLYDGTVSSATREGFKTSYKGILQISANQLATDFIEDPSRYLLKGSMAGFFVGVLDPIIAGPVERYKTYKITHEVDTNIIAFLKQIHREQRGLLSMIIAELYRGLGITIVKQSAMNSAFFITKHWADNKVEPYQASHPAGAMAAASIAAGIGAAVAGAPMDVIKTLTQQHTADPVAVLSLLRTVWQRAGLKGLIAGLPARFALISIGYGMNGFFLNLFAKANKSPKPKKDNKSINDMLLNDLTNKMESITLSEQDITICAPTMVNSVKANKEEAPLRPFDNSHSPFKRLSP
jgi:hypothetical protein